jgi:hypothetical protein
MCWCVDVWFGLLDDMTTCEFGETTALSSVLSLVYLFLELILDAAIVLVFMHSSKRLCLSKHIPKS